MIRCGETVLLRKPNTAIEHLWIVLTEAETDSGLAVIVNITSVQSHSRPDLTVVLRKGDHPFVTHDSIILYSDSRPADLRLVEVGIKNGHFSQHAPCSIELLKRVQEGLLRSDHTPNKISAYCKAIWK